MADQSSGLILILISVAAISGVFGFYNESRFCMFSGFKASHYDVIKPGYSHLGCGMKFYTVPGALSFLYDNRTDTCNFTTTTSVPGILCDYYTLNLFAPYATVIPSELCNKTHGDDSPLSDCYQRLYKREYDRIEAIDECENATCPSGTEPCVDKWNGFQCTCGVGMGGPVCDVALPTCYNPSAYCENNAQCHKDLEGQVICSCEAGYTGVVCETDIDECASDPCENNGTCADMVAAFECTCSTGYTGVTCDAEIDECLSGPCLNDATCNDRFNGYNCTCAPGFVGVHCETDIDECESSPCVNNGTCQDQINSYRCQWASSTGLTACESSPCHNSGACSDQVNGYICSCQPGYTGTHCETDIDECGSSPCANNGTCHDQVNSYRCDCVDGYTGSHCETDINECDSNPCENGATCNDHVNGYNCTCLQGFEGNRCETDINECASDPCVNGGACSDLVNGYTCNCVPGFTDSHCETNIDECGSNPCQYGGTCDDHVNGYNCTCAQGFEGPRCGTDIDECLSNPCRHGGACSDLPGSMQCECGSTGYTGLFCETDATDSCAGGSPGGSGCGSGQCLDTPGSLICKCDINAVSGPTCIFDVACEDNPCVTGTCTTDGSGSYTCTCDTASSATPPHCDLAISAIFGAISDFSNSPTPANKEITISGTLKYYNADYSNFFVSPYGYVTFETPLDDPCIAPGIHFLHKPIIAVFAYPSLTPGTVYASAVTDIAAMNLAKAAVCRRMTSLHMIEQNRLCNFSPAKVVVVTWNDMMDANGNTYSFQLTLVQDANAKLWAIFHYIAINSPNLSPAPPCDSPIVGYADKSGTLYEVTKPNDVQIYVAGSNIGLPGKYVHPLHA